MFESYNFYFIIISVLLSVLLGGVFFPLDYYSSHGDAERLILPGFKRLVRLLDPGSLLLPSKSNTIYSVKISYRSPKTSYHGKITLAAMTSCTKESETRYSWRKLVNNPSLTFPQISEHCRFTPK